MTTKPGHSQDLINGFFESSSLTTFQKAKFQHTWSIHDFSNYCELKKGINISSSIFSDGTTGGLKWRLEMNPILRSYNPHLYDYDHLDLNLVLVSNIFDNLEANCQLSILNGNLEEIDKNKKHAKFNEHNVRETFAIFRYDRLDPIYLCLPDDKLIILCEIVILGSDKNISSQSAMPNDLGLLLFENQDYTVITFSVSGKKLYALKTILVANSPVFAAMFSHNTKKNEINLIEIKDVDYEVMEQMLRYLYTNKISNLDSMADRLLILADKYALDHLKRMCEVSMSENLTIANAAKYYILADGHNAEELQSQVKNFIIDNAQDVQRSDGFKSHYSQHAKLFKALGWSQQSK